MARILDVLCSFMFRFVSGNLLNERMKRRCWLRLFWLQSFPWCLRVVGCWSRGAVFISTTVINEWADWRSALLNTSSSEDSFPEAKHSSLCSLPEDFYILLTLFTVIFAPASGSSGHCVRYFLYLHLQCMGFQSFFVLFFLSYDRCCPQRGTLTLRVPVMDAAKTRRQQVKVTRLVFRYLSFVFTSQWSFLWNADFAKWSLCRCSQTDLVKKV